jgi:hypothetical protein
MRSNFPSTASETKALALRLVQHLRQELKDTYNRKEWTARNLDALRSFSNHEYVLTHFPSEGSYKKGEFLYDYIAYQQDTGILIAAESEWNQKLHELQKDFDKLLYVRSPIKVFLFWLRKDEAAIENAFSELTKCMTWCSEYSPGEVYVLYCRTYTNGDGSNGDHVRWLQIEGEPSHCSLNGKIFEDVPS